MAELRPYQTAALERVRAEFSQGKRSVVVVSPTGSGKTVMMAEIVRRARERGARVLLVVHRRELAKQALKHLWQHGVEHVRVLLGGRSIGPMDAPVVVATVQTITSEKWFPHRPAADLVLWDECHHCLAKSFLALRDAYPDAKHIGFTATPERDDGSPMGDVFEAMVVVESIRGLTCQGHLVPCRVSGPRGKRKKLAEDPAIAYCERGEGRRAIIFCATVAHAKSVATDLVSRGVAAEAVDGSMRTRLRDAALARFASGETQVITNCNLITEGFDVPAAKCIVLARGCGSVAMYLQAIGRALRPEPGATDALLLDLRGAVYKHGLPDDDREFSLEGKPIGEGTAALTTCPDCGAVFAFAPKCPECGFVIFDNRPSTEVKREEIQELDPATFTEEFRRTEIQRLREIAASRGYRDGWIAHKFRERFGRWPNRAEAS